MDFHFLFMEKSWKISVGKVGAPCKINVVLELSLMNLKRYKLLTLSCFRWFNLEILIWLALNLVILQLKVFGLILCFCTWCYWSVIFKQFWMFLWVIASLGCHDRWLSPVPRLNLTTSILIKLYEGSGWRLKPSRCESGDDWRRSAGEIK